MSQLKQFVNYVHSIPEDREIAEFVSPHPQIKTVFLDQAKERYDRENADGKLEARIREYVEHFRAQIGALKDYGTAETVMED